MQSHIQYINNLHGHSPGVLHKIEQQNVKGAVILPNIGAGLGLFIQILCLSTQPKTIIELGTGCGYATIWMAQAVAEYGGKIITVDINKEVQNKAKLYIEESKLSHVVEFVLADAKDWVRNYTQKVDLILQDTYPVLYSEMLNDCVRLLKPKGMLLTHDAIIACHNAPKDMIAVMEQFNMFIANYKDLHSTLVPVDDGLWMSIKK